MLAVTTESSQRRGRFRVYQAYLQADPLVSEVSGNGRSTTFGDAVYHATEARNDSRLA